MKVETINDIRSKTPFKPFVVVADGQKFDVRHPDFIFVTPDKSTVIIVDKQHHLHIVDIAHISAITIKSKAA